MDFVSDALASGRAFRTQNVADDFTRRRLRSRSIASGGVRVTRVLVRFRLGGRLPAQLPSDNGSESTSPSHRTVGRRIGIEWALIEQGKPNEKAHMESFNGKFRDECLNEDWFIMLADARQRIERWRLDYNQARPHSSLGYRTPNEFRIEAEAGFASPPCEPQLRLCCHTPPRLSS